MAAGGGGGLGAKTRKKGLSIHESARQGITDLSGRHGLQDDSSILFHMVDVVRKTVRNVCGGVLQQGA